MLIDAHIHALSPDRRRYPVQPRLVEVPGATRSWWEEAPISAEEWLPEFSRSGVASGVLVQAFTSYGFDNSYVADSVAARPESFVGVGILDDTAPDAVQQMRRWVGERGLHGIRIVAAGKGKDEVLCANQVWEEAAHLRISLSFLMNFEQIPRLRLLLDHLHEVPVVVEHAAYASAVTGPNSLVPQAFLKLSRYPLVSTKVTGMNFAALRERGADPAKFMRQVVSAFGAERVMWGSNYPATHDRPYADLVDEGRAVCIGLTRQEQEYVFGKTAGAVFSRVS